MYQKTKEVLPLAVIIDIETRSQVATFLQEGRFKRPADAKEAAESLMAFISDGVPLPVKPQQTEIPLKKTESEPTQPTCSAPAPVDPSVSEEIEGEETEE